MAQIQTDVLLLRDQRGVNNEPLTELYKGQKFYLDLVSLLKTICDQGFSKEYEQLGEKLSMARFVRGNEAMQVVIIPTSPVRMCDPELMDSKNLYLRFSFNAGTGDFYEVPYYWRDGIWIRGNDIQIRTGMDKHYSQFGCYPSEFLCLLPCDIVGEFIFPAEIEAHELVSKLCDSASFLSTPDKEL